MSARVSSAMLCGSQERSGAPCAHGHFLALGISGLGHTWSWAYTALGICGPGTTFGYCVACINGLVPRPCAQVRKIAYKNQKFAAIDKAIGRDSLKFVTLLRLSPLLPLAASNYLYGLTRCVCCLVWLAVAGDRPCT